MGYFNECMSGFEHQVASHMMAEGMTDEALIITRSIHDRYHAAKRNPYNEIECSDHYARAMASYGTFITACGFEYHGPKGYIRFSPKWNKENFKAPFTAAEGWGTYMQALRDDKQLYTFDIKYGSLLLNTISVDRLNDQNTKTVSIMSGNQKILNSFIEDEKGIHIKLNKAVRIKENERLEIVIADIA